MRKISRSKFWFWLSFISYNSSFFWGISKGFLQGKHTKHLWLITQKNCIFYNLKGLFLLPSIIYDRPSKEIRGKILAMQFRSTLCNFPVWNYDKIFKSVIFEGRSIAFESFFFVVVFSVFLKFSNIPSNSFCALNCPAQWEPKFNGILHFFSE